MCNEKLTNKDLALNLISELKRTSLNCNIFSVYDYDCLSMQELLCTFFEKINQCVDISNKTVVLVDWLVSQGLSVEVAEKLDTWLKDGTLEQIINTKAFGKLENKINDQGVNAKDFGCKGDGLTDDTYNFKICLEYCRDNGLTMFLPSGIYILNETIFSSDTIESENALKPIVIKGSGVNNTKLNTNRDIQPVLNLSRSKTVIISDIGSDNSWIQPVQYGEVFIKWNKDRTLYCKDVLSFSRNRGFHGYNILINTPRPKNYDHENNDSNFYRYPIAIQNFSGYNAINIDNINVDENGDKTSNADGSSIGILEKVDSSVASILQDMTTSNRPIHQALSSVEGVLKSGIRNQPTYEVDYNGHIAIGCSTQANDPVARGAGAIKIRDINPMIRFYNASNNNVEYRIQTEGDKFTFVIDGEVPFECGRNGNSFLKHILTQLNFWGWSPNQGLVWSNDTGQNRNLYVDDEGILRLSAWKTPTNRDGDSILTARNGDTGSRPYLRSNEDVGFQFFDKTLNKPVWWNGSNWVDSTGSIV